MIVLILRNPSDDFNDFWSFWERSFRDRVNGIYFVNFNMRNLRNLEVIVEYERIAKIIQEFPISEKKAILTDVVSSSFAPIYRWENLSPIIIDENNLHSKFSQLIAMLILSFPEIHWYFNIDYLFGQADGQNSSINDMVYILREARTEILDERFLGYEPLFDPLGIRNRIRENLKTGKRADEFWGLPLRNRVAAAMDEEVPYALFNAYTAYKFGYRAWAIYTDTIARAVFGLGNNQNIDLVFEDLYLNFPDRPTGAQYSELKDRDSVFPGLRNVRHRIFVTVGHARTRGQKEKRVNNRAYLRALRATTGLRYKFLYKTMGGIHALWKRAGFYRNGKPRLAPGFQWPPDERKVIEALERLEAREGSGGHSAPGTLLTISQFMIERAKRILSEAKTVREALTAAVLALEAKELLMGRTPTTSYEALKIQHEAEAMAESMFLGVEYNLPLKERFEEIEREAKHFALWFRKSHRKRSELNARLTIAERLAKRFAEMNQFEEEQSALQEARKLRASFWMKQKPWRKVFAPIFWYIHQSMRSLTFFFAAVLLWAILFGFSYFGLAKLVHREKYCRYNLWDAFSSSAVFYVTLQSPAHWVSLTPSSSNCPSEFLPEKPEKPPQNSPINAWWSVFLTLQGFISLFNLGLLISHIYLIISRR